MWRIVRFATGLVAALALLTWAASVIVHRTTADWFENDLRLRAQLAVTGARQVLVSNWKPESSRELGLILNELAHDERILAAAACTSTLSLLVQTDAYPASFECATIGSHMRPAAEVAA